MTPNQGTAHVANVDGDWMLVLPTGAMRAFATREAAEKSAARWFASDAKRRGLPVGVGVTETDLNTGE